MGLFDDFSPSELSQFWQDQLRASEDVKPSDAKEEEPESYRAFLGDAWSFTKDKPDQWSSVNVIFAAFKGFLPQVLADMPKPSAQSLQGNDAYATLHNNLKSYRDRELTARRHCRDSVQDTFLRGTGAVRHDRDSRRGCARTRYFPVRDLFWDAGCCAPEDAKHMIERHSCLRWEFAQKFGNEVASEIRAAVEAKSSVNRDSVSPFDGIEYYLAWSKHGDERRVYAFHKDWNDDYLISEGGRPGEPWPFTFDDEEWPVSTLWFQRRSDQPWGFSYYDTAKGPIAFLQFAVSYLLSAMRKSSQQSVLYPREFGQVAQQIADARKHLTFIPYDPDMLNGVKPSEAMQVIEFPPLNAGFFQAMDVAKGTFEQVTGWNAMTMMNPGQVETASESVRMSQQAENRMADDQQSVEEWTSRCWRKEIQIDAKYMPTRSVLRVAQVPDEGPASFQLDETDEAAGSYAQVVETSQAEEYAPEELKTGIPYQHALLLEAGVKDVQSALQQVQAKERFEAVLMSAQAVGMQVPPQMMQQAQLEPAIQVRQMYGIPLAAKVEILEPGIEAFVGAQLAPNWIENMTPRQIKAELEIRTQRGSSQRIGHLQQWQEAMQVFSTLYPLYQARMDFAGMAALENFLTKAMENYDLDVLQRSPQQLQQFQQQMMLMQMQAQQQAVAQQQQGEQQQRQAQSAEKDKDRQARRQERAEDRHDKRRGELEQRERDRESDRNRQRDTRAKNLQQLEIAAMRKAA